MTRRCLIPSCLGVALTAMIFAATTPPVHAQNAAPPDRWSRTVWDAALHGDRATLQEVFDQVPAADGDSERARLTRRFLEQRDLFREHQEAALAAQNEDREEALADLRTAVEEDNRSKALRQAVIVQTLSTDFDEAFADEELMALVSWADRQVPVEERERRWIDAQELLYLLKTFYEDTDRRDLYTRYDDELERVNQRVALLAKYAPRVLYEMRADRVERMGEDPLPEYNEAREVRFDERLRDVDHRMLVNALDMAANEHIEQRGWRPLIDGGLESMEVVATTTALANVFPSLNDADAVNRFLEVIRTYRADLKDRADRRVDRRYCTDVLNRVAKAGVEILELPVELVIREFGDGALGQLDTYSNVIWPDELRRFEQQTAGDFVGIGVLIRHTDKREIMVVNPLEGTPAYQAGVRPNDLIMEVDGVSTAGWSLNDAVDAITGPRHQVVTLGLKREGKDDLIEMKITRDVIKIYSIKGWEKVGLKRDGEPIWDWYIDEASGIAYIRMTQFTNSTVEDLLLAWREIKEKGTPNGLILDLRHNPGGLLTAAVQVSNLFVPRGTIVSGENKSQQMVWRQGAMPHRALLEGMPTVVLVNKGSASASEIVSGCLQAHDAAVIVGERSYGKGSVQTVHHVHDKGRLKLTTQYYRLPSPDGITPGRLVHKRPGAEVWGVDPDIEVPMTVNQVSESIALRQRAESNHQGDADDDDADAEPADINDLIADGLDPQLQTALLILQAQALGAADVRHAAADGAPVGG